MAQSHYEELKVHLFPGDGNESIAFALCGRHETETENVYMVHRVELYPHDKCTIRKPDRVEWSPAEIVHLYEECRKSNLLLLKIHCHPGYWPWFSEVDTVSDKELNETLTGWINRSDEIVSVIMLSDGSIFGRVVHSTGEFEELTSIIVVGNDIKRFGPIGDHVDKISAEEDTQLRTKQAFGEGTINSLQRLKIGVVGCSGTGSIIAELLGRLGVGNIVLVDPDLVEYKNLNRILNTKKTDADLKRSKVEVLKEAIESTGTNVKVTAITALLHSKIAFDNIALCDVVFGCMDTIDGRHLLNRTATYYCIAYLDIGIRLDADMKGGINEILGRVDYLQPGGSSLFSRERYTQEQLKSADMARTNPDEYKKQISEKYIKSVNVESPAVISVNMMFSSQAVTELLARLHRYRDIGNERYAAVLFSLSGMFLITEPEGAPDQVLKEKLGLGTTDPLLDSPLLIL
jgi:proteasome lid subunit RPN8/RPN11